MQIVEYAHEFHVRINYDRFRVKNQNSIKLIPGARFDWPRKVFIVGTGYKEQLLELKNKETSWNPVEWIYIGEEKPQEIGNIDPMPDLNIKIDLAFGEMRPYQAQGVARGMQLKRYINGDEQGLGKTLQTIATLFAADQQGEDVFPALVICPSSTKINWKREWKQWVNKDAMILEDKVKTNWHQFSKLGMNDVFICNYESLKKYFVLKYPEKGKMRNSNDIIMDERFKLFKSIIIDESHRCKDPGTQQAKIILRICSTPEHKKEWVILLSGTPVVNKPIDLYPQLAIMNRLSHFGNKKLFLARYCEGGKGASNLKELNYLMNQNLFFRREKKDVAKDLPEKQRQTILCDITTRVQYNKAKNDFVKFLEDSGWTDAEIAKKLRGEIMVKMGELKRISALGKLNEVKEFIQEVMDSGKKLIVFCSLHSIVDAIREMFPKSVTVTGRDSMDQKQANIDKFQNDASCQLIVCNIKAAGVGITLTASSRVAFVEYPWTYADCVQCEDRAHRIGQTNNVMCTYFLGDNTIDEDLYKMIQDKRHTANSITGATDMMEMSYVDNMINLITK